MNADAESFIDNLTRAAQDNPLAAALIGSGALWLLLGNTPLGGVASGAASIARPIAGAGVHGANSTAHAIATASGAVAESVRSATRAASDALTGGAEMISDRASEGISRTIPDAAPDLNGVYGSVGRSYSDVQTALSNLFSKQPLLLGAIGLVIGATVAGAVVSTVARNSDEGSDDLNETVHRRGSNFEEHASGRIAGAVPV